MSTSRLLPLLLALSLPAWGDEAPADNSGPDKKPTKEEKKEEGKEDKPKETLGKITLGGVAVSYIAQTGTIPVLKDDGKAKANVFYVYYAATNAQGKRLAAADPGKRPITFCFNGGPGASAVWLHLGGLGPRRVNFPPAGLSPTSVAEVVDNPNSILDGSDLVFIDPVSTGLSRAAKDEKPEQFFGLDEDIQSLGEFVRLFTTREQRWLSPKYLCGESYGTTRVAGLAAYLQDTHGLYSEGLILMSGTINFQTLVPGAGNDLPYALFLPAMTATAHYHKKLAPELQADLEKALAESRAFAQGDYTLALMKGAGLTAEERQIIATKVARLTGLSSIQVEDQNLRLDPSFFRKALLRDQGKVIGRYDGRVTGPEDDRTDLRTDLDPSYSNIVGGFASAVNAYVRGELGYQSDHPYHVLAHGLPWRWTSFAGRYVSTEDRLANALTTNPKLRILVLSGLRDLAVPGDSMQYSIAHLPIPNSLRANITFSRFESGHMMYLFQTDAEKLRRELTEFMKVR